MTLKAIFQSLDEIPTQYRELYSQNTSGDYELTGIDGIKTGADIDRIYSSLTKERNDHKETKDYLAKYTSLSKDPTELEQKLDKFSELELAANGKIDDEKMNQIVEARLRTKLSPLERELSQIRQELQQKEEQIIEFKRKEDLRKIHDSVRKAAQKAKIVDTAYDDALMMAERLFQIDDYGNITTKDGVGVTPGINAQTWFNDMQKVRPHWWPQSTGSGANGTSNSSGGFNTNNNPFKPEINNRGQMFRLINENPDLARQLCRSAGQKPWF